MDVFVAIKIVPDDQDIQVRDDRTLDYSKARPVVSTYDLNAIEGAAQFIGERDAKLTAITTGDKSIEDSKVAKNILARGVDELIVVSDDAYADMESRSTAAVLAAAIKKQGNYDLIICGDGSADLYAQQVDVQLAEALGIPVVNGVTMLSLEGEKVIAERHLETEKETVEISLPAVVSVSPDIALPRICGMKEILSAGKKPVTNLSAAEVGVVPEKSVEVLDVLAPEPADRKLEIYDLSVDGDVQKFVSALAETTR